MSISAVAFLKNIQAVVAKSVQVSFRGRTVHVAYDKEAYAQQGYQYCMNCKVASLGQFYSAHQKSCTAKRDPSQIVHVLGQFGGGAIFGSEASKIREYVKRVVKSDASE
jgi:hypothetical protein